MVWGAECKPLHEYCNSENELLWRISLRGQREELFHDLPLRQDSCHPV